MFSRSVRRQLKENHNAKLDIAVEISRKRRLLEGAKKGYAYYLNKEISELTELLASYENIETNLKAN